MAWIFRSADRGSEFLRENSSAEWTVDQHHTLINTGDIVFLWHGDAEGAIIGVGKVMTQVSRSRSNLKKMLVRIAHSKVLTDPLSVEELQTDRALRGMPVLRRADKANYGLSKAQAQRLLSVLVARESDLESLLNMKSGSIASARDAMKPVKKPVVRSEPSVRKATWQEKLFEIAVQKQDEIFAEPTFAYELFLRKLALVRVRRLLVPEVLADITVTQFESELGRFGGVVINKRLYTLKQALEELGEISLDEMAEMVEDGVLETKGTLTWGSNAWKLVRDDQAGGVSALRLRAGLSHLLSDGLKLNARIDRMRRSVDVLWPETATGILMALEPERHVVYRDAVREGIANVTGMPELKPSLEGYMYYIEFMHSLRKKLGLASLAEADLLVMQIAAPDWLESRRGEEIVSVARSVRAELPAQRIAPEQPVEETASEPETTATPEPDESANDVEDEQVRRFVHDTDDEERVDVPWHEDDDVVMDDDMDEYVDFSPSETGEDSSSEAPDKNEPEKPAPVSESVVSVQKPSPEPPSRSEPEPVAKTAGVTEPNEGQALFSLYQQMRSRGVIIGLDQLTNVYLALKSVPVLVLGGPSGVGKHTIIRAMAAHMGARYHSVPMSSELGTGSSADDMVRFRDLLGKIDPRTGIYRPEAWYEALLDAHEHPDQAVIISADTVSEWREDYWFSEYLRLRDSQVQTQEHDWPRSPVVAVPGCAELTTETGRRLPGSFPFPDNVFLVMTAVPGILPTMLVSERVNFIELGPPDLSLSALRPGHPPEEAASQSLASILVQERQYRTIHSILDRPWIAEWNEEIEQINSILEEHGAAIGYRLRDEILLYLAYADDLNSVMPYGTSFPLATAFDYQLVQRILPLYVDADWEESAFTRLMMYVRGDRGNAPRFPRTLARLEKMEEDME